jgi:hypothetical protein
VLPDSRPANSRPGKRPGCVNKPVLSDVPLLCVAVIGTCRPVVNRNWERGLKVIFVCSSAGEGTWHVYWTEVSRGGAFVTFRPPIHCRHRYTVDSRLAFCLNVLPAKTNQLHAPWYRVCIYRVCVNYRRISLRHNLSRKCRKIVKFVSVTHSERNIWNCPIVATAISRE